MKKFLLAISVAISLSFGVFAQDSNPPTDSKTSTETTEKKRPPVFRATKEQIIQAQNLLKTKGHYQGEATGKLDDDTRSALKKYQEAEKIKVTGTLNRVTLEKMGIALTDKQKAIPVPPESAEKTSAKETSGEGKTKRGPVFRATKDQISQAQKMLKSKGLYNGEETGKLDDATRDSIKKFQEANGVKVTGTLNKETLLKMGIELTDKQKEM